MKTPDEIARDVIGKDALAGIGYERDLEVAQRAVAATLKEVASTEAEHHIEQSNITVEVQSPGVGEHDSGESDVLVLSGVDHITGETVILRISGYLDDFAKRVDDGLRAQGWDGAR